MANATITQLVKRIDSMRSESEYMGSQPERVQLAALYEALRFPLSPAPPMDGRPNMADSLKKHIGTCCGKLKEATMKKYVRSAVVSIKGHKQNLEQVNKRMIPYTNVNELTTLNLDSDG